VDEGFTEINHGDWEGRLADEIALEWTETLIDWHTKPETVKMPGDRGESLEDVKERAVKAADAIAKRYTGDVLLVSHDAVIKVLLCHWLGAPPSSFWRFQVSNCSITVVEAVPGKEFRMLLMGDAAHIGSALIVRNRKGYNCTAGLVILAACFGVDKERYAFSMILFPVQLLYDDNGSTSIERGPLSLFI